MNPLFWVLLSYPAYLFAQGRFVDYLRMMRKGDGK